MSVSHEVINSGSFDTQPYSGRYPSETIDQCRSLVAQRYLEVGYITEDELDEQGHLNGEIDPYVGDSEYFWRTDENGNVIATLRIIHPSKQNPRLPMEKSFPLFLPHLHTLTRVSIENPDSVVEISALAKAKEFDKFAALDMYKAVWQHAKRTGIELCAISADVRLHRMLAETFGDSIELAGEPAEMMGSLTVPSLLYPDKCAEAVARIYKDKLESGKLVGAEAYRSLIGYLIEGLESERMSAQELAAFRSLDLPVEEPVLTKYI